MSFLAQGVLAKDGRLEKITLLVSVPIELPIEIFKKFPYHKPIRDQNESHNIFFQNQENKFLVLIIYDIHWIVTSSL